MADFSGSDPIIYREPLQTEQYDSLSLNGKFRVVARLQPLVVIENVMDPVRMAFPFYKRSASPGYADPAQTAAAHD